MRFLADMGISPKTVAYLCDLGHDAEHLQALGLGELPDPNILARARRDESILLTHDLDFGELVAASGLQLPSVITFRLRDMRATKLNRYIKAVIEEYSAVIEQGAIISITEARVRIRLLPIRG